MIMQNQKCCPICGNILSYEEQTDGCYNCGYRDIEDSDTE